MLKTKFKLHTLSFRLKHHLFHEFIILTYINIYVSPNSMH